MVSTRGEATLPLALDSPRPDHLTQEIVFFMLGTPRTGVTMAAGALQDAGLIRYKRRKITIIDRGGLEETSCECYRINAESLDHFLAA